MTEQLPDRGNFQLAKQLSYDFSSEFKACSPRLEGQIENCKIGEDDANPFVIDQVEEEMKGEEEEFEDGLMSEKKKEKIIEGFDESVDDDSNNNDSDEDSQ